MIVKIRDIPATLAKQICRSNDGPGWKEEMEKYLGKLVEMVPTTDWGRDKEWYRHKEPDSSGMYWLWPMGMLEFDLTNDPYVQSLEKL